jgi:aconitate hydratase
LVTEPLGTGSNGQSVYLRDIWPSSKEIAETVATALTPAMFRSRYADVFEGPAEWQAVKTVTGQTYGWEADSTYVRLPPLFDGMGATPAPLTEIKGARLLALFGDSITTDHISPAGDIKKSSPAGRYLIEHGVPVTEFNSYGARRGNHEVMMRGTFANIRIKNELLGGEEGGNTKHVPSGDKLAIYDAAMRYQAEGVPLIVIAGKEYGTGSSRDWAAKGTRLLGIRAVIAESFERIHRSNLVGMGILPLEFKNGMTRADLKLTGTEHFAITGFIGTLKPRADIVLVITRPDGSNETVPLLCRIDTMSEVDYFHHGGVLHYVLRNLVKTA